MGCGSSKSVVTSDRWSRSTSPNVEPDSCQHVAPTVETEAETEVPTAESPTHVTTNSQIITTNSDVAPPIKPETEVEVSFADFPTHVTLAEANRKYRDQTEGRNPPKNGDGTLKPFPGFRKREDIFDLEKFKEFDAQIDKVHFVKFYVIIKSTGTAAVSFFM